MSADIEGFVLVYIIRAYDKYHIVLAMIFRVPYANLFLHYIVFSILKRAEMDYLVGCFSAFFSCGNIIVKCDKNHTVKT